MATGKWVRNSVWVIVMVLSLIFLTWTLLVLILGRHSVLEDGLALGGASLVTEDLDEATLGFLTMAMLKPLWEEVWIGILGVYCALGLRQKKRHAWTLGLLWGIMLVANGAIQGGYEVLALKWSHACMQTYIFLLLGAIAVLSLSLARREFLPYPSRRQE